MLTVDRHYSGAVAMEGYFHFDTPFAIKIFPFPLVTAKLLCDYFDIREYGAKNTFQLITPSINLRTEF
jgi:hypothetical protein